MNRIEILILAAGTGTRMGAVKPLLMYKGHTLLSHVARCLRTARSQSDLEGEIRVVTGYSSEAVSREARRLGLGAIYNPDFGLGLMSSVQAGLREIQPLECSGVLVALADQPLVKPESVTELIQAFVAARSKGLTLARPSYEGKPGNPCLIGREHFEEILEQRPQDRGANFLFLAHPSCVLMHPVDDPGIHMDFDSPSDLHQGGLHV